MRKILKISPQVIQNSRQYLLLRTDVVQKTVVGCPLWLSIVQSLKNISTVYPFHYFLYYFIFFYKHLIKLFPLRTILPKQDKKHDSQLIGCVV